MSTCAPAFETGPHRTNTWAGDEEMLACANKRVSALQCRRTICDAAPHKHTHKKTWSRERTHPCMQPHQYQTLTHTNTFTDTLTLIHPNLWAIFVGPCCAFDLWWGKGGELEPSQSFSHPLRLVWVLTAHVSILHLHGSNLALRQL